MDVFANGFSVDAILGILRRRGWVALTLFSVCLAVGVGLIAALPDIYRAGATILVEGQQIPQEYVRSTVTMGIDHRLQVISQEVLSRARLAQLVTQFGLYEDLKEEGLPEESIVAVMRRDIGLEVKGRSTQRSEGTVAFEVSYTNPDPEKAMQVTNTLASFYVEGNTKVREQQSEGTAEFLRNELEEVKKKLEDQERQVAQYKRQYMGELPEQLPANLGTLTMLQTQMQVLSDSLARAHERRSSVLARRAAGSEITAIQAAAVGPETLPQRIERLRNSLAQMKTHFSDRHPDVVRLKAEIADVENQLKRETPNPGSAAPAPVKEVPPDEGTAINTEINRLTADLAKIRNDIVKYQQRIEQTPRREQELLALSRDYNSTRELYATLLKRLDEAKLADSLERGQKAERFRLIEPATYPREPAGPKRGLFLGLALVLSLGAAAAAVIVKELLDTSFHGVETLKAFTDVPVLGTVPRLLTEREQVQSRRRRLLGVIVLAVGLPLLCGISYELGTGGERLVRIFLG